ncbi:MAG TPA: DUF1579 family protein [Thermoanaerobaculia bacterium]|nr:DUF1579 family protein [Thermoanaerobaculia bacterium]
MLTIALLGLSLMAVAPEQPAPADERIRRAKEIYLPGPPHSDLAKLAGDWDVLIEYASGEAEPVRACGRVSNRIILGGRFILSEGGARTADGQFSSEAIHLFGYDGRTREYTVIVLDSFGTYYVTAAGPKPAGAGQLAMSGETADGSGRKKFDVILRWIDQDTYETDIVFHFPGRDPVVAVAATHRRAKSASSFTCDGEGLPAGARSR